MTSLFEPYTAILAPQDPSAHDWVAKLLAAHVVAFSRLKLSAIARRSRWNFAEATSNVAETFFARAKGAQAPAFSSLNRCNSLESNALTTQTTLVAFIGPWLPKIYQPPKIVEHAESMVGAALPGVHSRNGFGVAMSRCGFDNLPRGGGTRRSRTF